MTDTTTVTPAQAGVTRHYRISWTEVSAHEVTVTEEQLAQLRTAGAAEDPDDITDGLADGLATLDDDGFMSVTRQDICVDEVR